jgi:hypothetical protein
VVPSRDGLTTQQRLRQIDTTGTPVTFDAGAFDGFLSAQVHNVASHLKVQYDVTLVQFCDCSSDTFSLPK